MAAVIAALSIMVTDVAEARRGMSVGSRGTRTYSAPPPTTTAPSTTAPMTTAPAAARPGAAATAARPQPRSSFFGSGLAGGLMRGLLIGGLIGLLLGHGLGGLAGLLGLLAQGALLALVVVLVMRFFRRPQPVPAGAQGGAYSRGTAPGAAAGGWPPGGAGAAPAPSAPRRGPVDEIGITAADLDMFERLLGEIETAFGREDEAALKARTTPEVFAAMADELKANAARGVRNEVGEVKLLQGDIAESWREGPVEYATVAMRYESRDVVVDRATGRFLSGDRDRPGQSTEVWTFAREAGGPWRLSAMQPV